MNAKVVQRIVYCYCFQQHCFRSLLFVVIIPVGVAVAMVTDVLASRRIRRHEEVARWRDAVAKAAAEQSHHLHGLRSSEHEADVDVILLGSQFTAVSAGSWPRSRRRMHAVINHVAWCFVVVVAVVPRLTAADVALLQHRLIAFAAAQLSTCTVYRPITNKSHDDVVISFQTRAPSDRRCCRRRGGNCTLPPASTPARPGTCRTTTSGRCSTCRRSSARRPPATLPRRRSRLSTRR